MAKTIIVDSRKQLELVISTITNKWEQFKYGRVDIRFGPKRTSKSNQMMFEQYHRIASAMYGGDIDHARAECKLNIGVPILRDGNEDFRKMYDHVVAPHDYGTQLAMMQYLPVTSEMSPDEAKKYIDDIFDVYAEKGIDWRGLDDDEAREKYNAEKAYKER